VKRPLLALLLAAGSLCAQSVWAAIAFVATSTGPSVSATSETLTLPTGYNTAGNVTVAVFAQTCASTDAPSGTFGGTGPVFTAPTGWTVLLSSPCTLIVYRAYVSGDGSTITASSTATSNWWMSIADTYSGCDTTTPIDNFSSFVTYRSDNTALFRAPQLNPNFNNSMLLVGFTSNQSSGSPSWSAKPSGFTQRGNTDVGTHIWTGEKALSTGAATGDQTITGENSISFHVGFQLALKQSGASAATLATAYPYIAGLSGQQFGSASNFQPALDHLSVQNNDLVVLIMPTAGIYTPPAGYTNQNNTVGGKVYTHLWLTGDTLVPTFTYVSGSNFLTYTVFVLRAMGAGTTQVYLDQLSAALTSGTTAVTGTTNSITPAGASELLLTFFGRNTSTGTDAWSAISGGLTVDINSSAMLTVAGHVSPAASPTGSFSATDTVSGQTFGIEAVAALFTVIPPGSGTVARHKLLLN
jgi:hypothetical protein